MTTEAQQEMPRFEVGRYTFRVDVTTGTDNWLRFKRAMMEALEMQVDAVIQGSAYDVEEADLTS